MKILCIYHSRDLDGWASAAIVNNYYKDKDVSLQLTGWDYGDNIPYDLIGIHDRIIMVDIALPKSTMDSIFNELGTDFIWIDHHKSSIKENDIELITGRQDTNKAACELTWEYFYPNKTIPKLFYYLGMYDSFRHRGTDEEDTTLKIQYSARAHFRCPEDFDGYFKIIENKDHISDKHIINGLIDTGESIIEYVKSMAFESIKRGFEINLKGKIFLTVDENRLNPSKFGVDYHTMGYDGFASFWYRSSINKWEFSLYSDDNKTDVSKIAKSLGGGGHFGAAGFIVDDIENFLKKHKRENLL